MNTPVQNKQQLIALLQLHSNHIQSYGVLELGIFGSFVKNSVTENSDVDFFIHFNPNYKTLKNLVGLSHYLQGLVGRKVEIVTPQSLNKFIGKYIIQEVEYVSIAA